LGLVVGGIIIYQTHLYWIDPLLSIIICLVIIVNTWTLLKDSLKLSLDGVPDNVNIQKVKEEILNTNGVKDFHHIHIWAISTTQNALTGHLVVSETLPNVEIAKIKDKLKHKLEHLNIQHTTLETEFENDNCDQTDC
jgi:cobalt-zinc-cadmium efflux system protein